MLINTTCHGQVNSQFQYKTSLVLSISSQIHILGENRGRGRQLWNIRQQYACLFKSHMSRKLEKRPKRRKTLQVKVIPPPRLLALGSCVSSAWHEICTWLYNSIEETAHHKCLQLCSSEMNRNATCFVMVQTHARASCFLTVSPSSSNKNFSIERAYYPALFPLLLSKGTCKFTPFLYSFL